VAHHAPDATEGMMTGPQSTSFERVGALMRKEFAQIRRDRRLAISLILPPTLQLLLLGFALSTSVTNLKLGVVDYSHTASSRDLIAALTESRSFRLAGYYASTGEMTKRLASGRIDAGLVIAADHERNLARGRPATVQFLLNAMNAYTAQIAQGYAQGVIQAYNQTPGDGAISAAFLQTAQPAGGSGIVELHPAYLYNPGLRDSWFIVTGVFGLLLILNSSLVAAGAMVKEREAGTIEQLLMSPASTSEIIFAKVLPLFVLLFLMSLLAVAVMKIVFGVPFHGNLPLVLCGAALCILSGISLGTVNATFSRTAMQAQLTVFFINPPLNSTAGALNPVEAMPRWLQPFTVVNPIHHFAVIARGSLLKGSGFAELWPNFLGLSAFTLVLGLLSMWRFRRQLTS
jgi:ABC-2 type transport system permease protein